MHLSTLEELRNLNDPSSPIKSGIDTWVFSLGKFDGFHLGHHRLLQEMRKYGNKLAILSFSNHPYSVLQPSQPIKMLQTIEHRIECARKEGIDLFVLEPFTLSLSNLSYGDFLAFILEKIPFKHLVLGEDARFGKNREGDVEHVTAWCKEKGIQAHYIAKEPYQGQPVSSRTLREAITRAKTPKQLEEVSALLDRPYTLMARFQKYGNRYALSKHHLENLVLPVMRNARVEIVFEGNSFPAELHYEPPFDLHLENLKLDVPAGIFEVKWIT